MAEIATDNDTLTRLQAKGWRPTVNSDQLLKMYTGFVGNIRIVPASDTRPGRVEWAVWFSGERPVCAGHEPNLIRAANRIDRAVDRLYALPDVHTPVRGV